MHRLSGAVLAARAPSEITSALVLELRDALALSQVHLTEVSRGSDVGLATVAEDGSAELSSYVQVLDERPSGVALVVASGAPPIVADAPASPDVARTWSTASTSPRWPTCP